MPAGLNGLKTEMSIFQWSVSRCLRNSPWMFFLSDMADDTLFEFLHMEIVAHMYKEQATREDIDKVPSTSVQMAYIRFFSALIMFLLQRFASCSDLLS